VKILQEFVTNIPDIRRDIIYHIPVIREHLMKLYLYSDVRSNDVNIWKDTICSALSSLPKKSQPGKSYPTSNEVYKWSWLTWEDTIIDKYDYWIKEFVRKDYPYYEFYQKANSYFKWLSEMFGKSKNGTVDSNDIYRKLDDIFDIQ